MNSGMARAISNLSLLFSFGLLVVQPQRLFARPQFPQTLESRPADLASRAERGDPGAQYQLARSILDRDSSPEVVQTGLEWLRASAAHGNPSAAFYLGYLYEHGRFVNLDCSLAFRNYELAARAHYPPAENNLAYLYQHGLGVQKDLDKAFEWYLAAAEHGDPLGQYNLATLYHRGNGTRQDDAEAVHWLRVAADSGLPEAQADLAAFYLYGVAVKRDDREAARLIRLAVEQGLASAETGLGFLYEQGKGVPLDYVAAYSWYSRAIAAGDISSQDRRKRLAQIMTRKQLEAAASLTAREAPAPPTSSAIAAFSLRDH